MFLRLRQWRHFLKKRPGCSLLLFHNRCSPCSPPTLLWEGLALVFIIITLKIIINSLSIFLIIFFIEHPPFWTSAIWLLQCIFLISRYIAIVNIATIILIFISKRIPLPSCRCGQPRTLHKVQVIIQNIGLQLWIIRFHYFHKLQWIAVITCTSCEFWEAFLFFISHSHINHIQSCVHIGADRSTLFCLKLSGKIIGGLFHVLELKHWACSD